jgi:NTP pyrophosphatase (non-canonical NTP hydrolase)
MMPEWMQAVRGELDHAYAKHGREPWGRHEFYAVLLEEVEELWEAIKSDAPQQDVLAELRQVIAMCVRYVETGDRYRGAHPPIPMRPHHPAAEKGMTE